jgi:T5SS/PEP-CTERM-associated repeat protein
VNITGPDSHGTFTNLFVGDTWVGSITVSDGAGLSCTGTLTSLGVGTNSRGTANIMGAGSRWMNSGTLMIGDRGQSTMNVTGGGRVQSADALVARGDIAASVTIDGPGSRWDISGPLQIARFGLGSVNITGGGVVASGGGLLGLSSIGWGTILVSGTDSRWTSTGSTLFGADDLAKGFLTISAGGAADAPEAHLPLPAAEGATGLVVVTGANSRWTIAFVLGIGNSSDPLVPVGGGRLEISDGGFVRAGHALNVGDRGTINLNGATLAAGFSGLTNLGAVNLLSNPGNVVGKVHNLAGGRIRVEGTQATFHNDVFNAGELRVSPGGAAILLGGLDGAAPGTLIVDAGGMFTAMHIRRQTVALGGLVRINPDDGTNVGTSRLKALSIDAGGQFDLSNNAMVIDYDGASPLNLIGSYLASGFANGAWNGDGINSSIAAITPNRAIGFAENTDIGAPLIFAGQVGGDLTSVLARYTIPGDADLDQFVGIGDFAVLGANFNKVGYWAKGDFNYDNLVNIADFSLLAANFNQSLPADLSWNAIPEPAGALSAAVALLLSRRRF